MEVFFRSPSNPEPHQFQRTLIERISELDERGVIDSHEVTIFGGKLCRCEACASTEWTRERLAEIERWRAWAAEEGVSLCLDEHSVRNSITGEEYEFVVPPTATLVLCIEGTIGTVLPHHVDRDIVTPGEFLSAFVEGDHAQPDTATAPGEVVD